MMNKTQLIKNLRALEIVPGDYVNSFERVCELCLEYMKYSGDDSIGAKFENFLDNEEAEDRLRQELNVSGLEGAIHFLGSDDNFHVDRGYRINEYGSLENIDRDCVENLIADIIETLEETE